MKKGRKYIEPMLGAGDKKGTNIPDRNDKRRNEAGAKIKNMKKATPKISTGGKAWDGVSRPSTDKYRDAWNRIFVKEENNE